MSGTTPTCVYTDDMTTTQTLTQFTIGQELAARSACDHNTIFRFTVLSRSAKFVTLQYHNTTKRVGIKVRDGVEYCFPLGHFSMAPIVRAGE